jgi:hypothetical protein
MFYVHRRRFSYFARVFKVASKNRPNPKRSKFGEFSYISLSLSVAIEIERPCARASDHKHQRERSGLTSCRCFKFRRVAESFCLRILRVLSATSGFKNMKGMLRLKVGRWLVWHVRAASKYNIIVSTCQHARDAPRQNTQGYVRSLYIV